MALQAGSDANHKDQDLETELHKAAEKGDHALAQEPPFSAVMWSAVFDPVHEFEAFSLMSAPAPRSAWASA